MSTDEKGNISQYKKHKLIARLKKTRSPHEILFSTSDPDGWFIDVIWYKKKTGEISDKSLIIKKDLDIWMRFQKSLGWEEFSDI